jgi:hypothetical protein
MKKYSSGIVGFSARIVVLAVLGAFALGCGDPANSFPVSLTVYPVATLAYRTSVGSTQPLSMESPTVIWLPLTDAGKEDMHAAARDLMRDIDGVMHIPVVTPAWVLPEDIAYGQYAGPTWGVPSVYVQLKASPAKRLASLTKENTGQYVAAVMDGTVVCVLKILDAVENGQFTVAGIDGTGTPLP